MTKDEFNDALVAHNTAMAGEAEMLPNPTGDELRKRMAAFQLGQEGASG